MSFFLFTVVFLQPLTENQSQNVLWGWGLKWVWVCKMVHTVLLYLRVFVCRATRAAQETGASENMHKAAPDWTFKKSQDQTPTPSPPLQMNIGNAIKVMCISVNEALKILLCCHVMFWFTVYCSWFSCVSTVSWFLWVVLVPVRFNCPFTQGRSNPQNVPSHLHIYMHPLTEGGGFPYNHSLLQQLGSKCLAQGHHDNICW